MASYPRYRRAPLDNWAIREKLALATSVLRSGDQNWVSVSRCIKPFAEPNRPSEWFSQKSCALQYADLLEKVETPKRKRNEKGEGVEMSTPGVQIVRRLTIERIEQLKSLVQQEQEAYKKLRAECDGIMAGDYDDKLEELWTDLKIDAVDEVEEDSAVSDVDHSLSTPSRKSPVASSSNVETNQEFSESFPVNPDLATAAIEEVVTTLPTIPTPTVSPIKYKSPAKKRNSDVSTIAASSDVSESDEISVTEEVENNEEVASSSFEKVPQNEKSLILQDINISGPEDTKVEIITDAEIKVDLIYKSDSTDQVSETVLNAATVSNVAFTPPSLSESQPIVKEDDSNLEPAAFTEVESEDVPAPLTAPEDAIPDTADENNDSTTDKSLTVKTEETPLKSPCSSDVYSPTYSTTSINSLDLERSGGNIPRKRGRKLGRKSLQRAGRSRASGTKQDDSQISRPAPETETTDEEDVSVDTPVGTPLPSVTAQDSGISTQDDAGSSANKSSLVESLPNSPMSSGVTDSEDEKTMRLWRKSIMLVWRAAANHKYANVFLHPVKEDIAPGYRNVIYRPMDLTTIKKNIENGSLRTTAEFQRDMMLMFTNALMYNDRDHDVNHMATEMYNDVMYHIEQYINTQMLVQTDTPKMLRTSRRSEIGLSDKEDDLKKRRSSSEQQEPVIEKTKKKR